MKLNFETFSVLKIPVHGHFNNLIIYSEAIPILSNTVRKRPASLNALKRYRTIIKRLRTIIKRLRTVVELKGRKDDGDGHLQNGHVIDYKFKIHWVIIVKGYIFIFNSFSLEFIRFWFRSIWFFDFKGFGIVIDFVVLALLNNFTFN